MAITDLANNPISPSSSSFLGFRSPIISSPFAGDGVFKHDIYSMLIKSIRDCDQASGELLLRWLASEQSEFEDTYERIQSLGTLYDPANAPAEALQYVKALVGFTSELDGQIGSLTEDELRRLVASAVRMWKFKGSVKGLVESIQALTTRTARFIDYFRFRTLVDEVEIGQAELDIDPWLVDQPGFSPSVQPDTVSVVSLPGGDILRFKINGLLGSTPAVSHQIRMKFKSLATSGEIRPSYDDGSDNYVDATGLLGQTTPSTNVNDYLVGVDPDEYVSDLRVVDDGSVNRTLIEGIVSLQRRANERIFIRWVDFQDDFRRTFDWEVISGTATPDQDNGQVLLEDGAADTVIGTDFPGDVDWTEVVTGSQWSLRDGTGWGEFRFYYTDEDNFYAVRIEPSTKTVSLEKVTASVRSVLDSTVLTAYHVGQFYFIHAQAEDTGSGHQLSYFLDGNLLGQVVDIDHTEGRLAMAVETGQQMTLTLADLYEQPLDSTRVGPP